MKKLAPLKKINQDHKKILKQLLSPEEIIVRETKEMRTDKNYFDEIMAKVRKKEEESSTTVSIDFKPKNTIKSKEEEIELSEMLFNYKVYMKKYKIEEDTSDEDLQYLLMLKVFDKCSYDILEFLSEEDIYSLKLVSRNFNDICECFSLFKTSIKTVFSKAIKGQFNKSVEKKFNKNYDVIEEEIENKSQKISKFKEKFNFKHQNVKNFNRINLNK